MYDGLTLKTKILILITALLFILCIVFSFDRKQEKSIVSELLPQSLSQEIASIKIFYDSKEVQIKKLNGEFFLFNSVNDERYKVKDEKIKNVFTALATKNKMTAISKNSFAQLKDEIKFVMRDKNEKIISEIIFARPDVLGVHRFIKFANGTIYKALDIYTDTVQVAASYWIERQIFKNVLPNADIQSIALADKTLIRNDANGKNFIDFENSLRSFQVLDIFTQALEIAKNNCIDTTKRLRITFGNRKTIQLECTKLESGDYLIFSSLHGVHYLASSYAVEKLFAVK